jgi:2-oxoglutarate dehydrogenase E2 component (dihydrolipoamide succinyltransferase)
VKAFEPLAEIETDKVMVEVAAPENGAIIKINVNEGDAVHPGDLLCTFGNTDVSASGNQAEAMAESTTDEGTTGTAKRQRLSPAVRHRLMKHGIDPNAINGSGRNGRITLKDVETYLAQPVVQTQPVVLSKPELDTRVLDAGESLKVPHDTMRQRIAAHMVESLLHTAPHVTSVFEVDLTAVMRHRAANKEEFARRGRPLTLTVYFIAAAVAAIRKVPQVNSQWHDDFLEIFADMNIGIATALDDQGLIVPVLGQANEKSLSRIAADLNDLTNRARDGKLDQPRPGRQTQTGRRSWRHLHHFEPWCFRQSHGHTDHHQSAAVGHPRRWQDRKTRQDSGSRWGGRHDDPADGVR